MSQRTKQQVKLQDSKTLTRHWDAFGRPVGYSVDGDRKQSITYDPATGRIAESDDIGNRTAAEGKTYTSNALNQYTAIDDFAPEYDADGNQTLIKTETGIWSVTYNAENRPIRWQSGDTVITMAFDRMGRRVWMRESEGDMVTKEERFVYDGYLCVQRLDATQGNAVRTEFVWDPTEPIATRPLVMRAKNWDLNLFYTHDGNKNVSEVFYHALQNSIAAHYDYAPFGAVTRTSRATRVTNRDLLSENPFRFSSEYHDATLGLVYYNYRHYNPQDGRWSGFDSLERGCANLYSFLNNNPVYRTDILGLMEAKSWAVGLCARNVGNFNPESVLFRIRSLNLEVYLRQWTHQYINRIVPDHHDVRVQTYPCEDCKGEPIDTITRGFQADSFNDAIFEYLLSKVPFRSENGWVAGHVEDARSPGHCSMQCVPKERYEKVKNKIQRSSANRYHLMLYNCQTWAREQLQE